MVGDVGDVGMVVVVRVDWVVGVVEVVWLVGVVGMKTNFYYHYKFSTIHDVPNSDWMPVNKLKVQ